MSLVSYRSISAFEGYFRWNDALFRKHYNRDFDGRNSYLDLSETELGQIYRAEGWGSSSNPMPEDEPLNDPG